MGRYEFGGWYTMSSTAGVCMVNRVHYVLTLIHLRLKDVLKSELCSVVISAI